MTAYIEVTLSWLFKNQKGRDAKSFYTHSAFDNHKDQTIEITSPDLGSSPAALSVEYTYDGVGKIPSLKWKAPTEMVGEVKEWLLVCEDPDAPLPTPIAHGIYMGIPPDKTSVENADFEVQDASQCLVKGGFHYQPRRGKVYIPPRPLMNHGPHRYFWQIVALSEPLDKEFVKSKPTKEQIAEAINGKVLSWGLWIGACERKWS
ncbi:phosphatidylethanolamine-binding protein [Coniochaeta sp. 2T2.1]|nr:phosphatidylethanolamine-binding protein [Coniochaeta sp. 2T2.1]